MQLMINKVMQNMLVAGLLILPTLTMAAGTAINEKRSVAANEKIQIEVMRGEVSISAINGKEFKISGTLDEKADGFDLTSKNGATRFEVLMPRQVSYSGWGSEKDVGSKLTIEVPIGSEVEFKGVNSDIKITGVQGGVKIGTVNGAVHGEKLTKDVLLETVNGQIISLNNQGRVSLTSVNGEIHDKGSSGRLNIESVNGEIDTISSATEVEVSVVNGEAKLELNGTERLEFSSVNGEITADLKNSKKPRIKSSSVSGSSKLTLDSDVSARFNLGASAGGDIENGLSADKAKKAKYGPRRSLDFTLGDGAGEIDMSTVSGDIILRKR